MRSVVVLCLLAACVRFDGDQSLPTPDAAKDGAPVSDGPGNDAPLGCESNFQTIAGGQPNHRYAVIVTAAAWQEQHNLACIPQNSYLAIPNDAGELMALENITGTSFWVGVSDLMVEDEPRDVLGNLYTALSPSGNLQNDDCVALDGISLDYETCGLDLIAVCECEEN